MKHTRHDVTDHAVVAYLERVRGVDLQAIRQKIARQTDLALEHEGASAVVVDGFRYRIINGVVTDVIATHQPKVKTGRVKR